jgi:acyl-coenzyme A thioesterase PaaI-like protein
MRSVSHYPRCYGCGSTNPKSLALRAEWDGTALVAAYTPPPDAEGGPGVVHGGYVAALVDEALSLAATAVASTPPMTRRIEIDYRAPTLTQRPLSIRAWVEEIGERKLILRLTARSVDFSHICFEAKGVYVKVPIDAWIQQMDTQQNSTADLDFTSGDPSNYFRWQTEGSKKTFVPTELTRPLRVVVALSDVAPSEWTFFASHQGLEVQEGASEDYDAKFVGSFWEWQELTHSRTSVDDLLSRGVEIRGQTSALTEFARALRYGQGPEAPNDKPDSASD